MKKRSQIAEELKWDLSGLIKNEEEIKNIFEIMQKLTEILPTYSGKLGNKELLLERLTKYQPDFIKIQKLGSYLGNCFNVDSANVKILELNQKFSTLSTKLNQADSFFMPQMYELSDEYLTSLLNDKRFADFDNTIKEIIKLKPHKLDEKTTELLAKMGSFLGNNENLHSILNDSEMTFADAVDSKGKTYKVDNSTSAQYLRSKDGVLRKSTFTSRMNGYKALNKTFAELYIKDMELDKFSTELAHYPDLLTKELLLNDIPRSVFDNIINTTNKQIPLLQSFVKTQAKISGNKQFAYYDLFEDNKIGGKIDIPQAKELILNALQPLGEDYVSIAKRKLNDKTIDFLPNKNKYSGAYCANCFDADTVILMNYLYDYESVSTLAHELGHCVNAEYFNNNQPYEKAEITIFAAEIASIVNEILLTQYMLKNATTKQKSYYLHKFLDGVRSTIYRQVLFSEFELFAHQKIENEQPITYADLNKCYADLNKKYYGTSCKLPEGLQYEWSRIPHFYSPYYVYAYATGMVTAITIASRVLNEASFAEKYIKFLKNGTNKNPVEMLKEIGIDLTTTAPFETAFKFIQTQLNEYKSLNK